MPNGKTPKELGYETQDVGWPLILWSLGGLTVFTVISVFALLGIFSERGKVPLASDAPAPVETAVKRPIPAGPLLQPKPPVDMAEYKTNALTHLNTYGWVDEEAGKVHVPIDHAIQMALEIENEFPTGVPETPPADESAEEQAPAATESTDATPAEDAA
jgi:hypothetical protein